MGIGHDHDTTTAPRPSSLREPKSGKTVCGRREDSAMPPHSLGFTMISTG